MNTHGTNTAVSTSPTATTGPATSSIALTVASRGDIPSSTWCCTASTTTMASSTTIPTASTSPKSVRLLIEYPSTAMVANVPTMATGTAASGMTAARQLWRNTSITMATRMTASRSVLNTSLIDSLMNGVVSYTTAYSTPAGHPGCCRSSATLSFTRWAVSIAFVPVSWYTESATDGRP